MPESIKALIEREDCVVFDSIVSIWEMAIKVGLGKLQLFVPIEVFVPTLFLRNGFRILRMRVDHTLKVAAFPIPHKDPFDRILIAQSLVESIPIASADTLFDAHGAHRVW